uniref:Pentacotripeptide-repeat region of PRORP domain-containing protein n=1 Tax=Oryza meridionalis TaxID=40149 RepID=A0A0E0CA47_9ORYZ
MPARVIAWQAVGCRQAVGYDAEGQYASELSIITYSLLADGYGKAGKMSNNEGGKFPTSAMTYNMLIAGFFVLGANGALSDMKERGLEPTKMLAWEKAGLEVDVRTYGVLVHALYMEGHMKDARKLFQSMDQKGVEPGNRRELIQGSEVDHGNEAEGFDSKFRKEAEALLDDMVRAGLQTSEPICQFTECQGKIERFVVVVVVRMCLCR